LQFIGEEVLMNRLTAEERRRAAELRRASQSRAPRAIAIPTVASRPESRLRSARVAALVTLALGGVMALIEIAQRLATYGPASLLDWLLPRL
jgi:hypothetical protein